MNEIRIAAPIIGDAETNNVLDVLRSGVLAAGPQVAALESQVAQVTDTEHVVAVSSGTAAIHAALHGLGVGPGDEVIAVPFTFVATVNPAIMLGAKVRFADVNVNDFCIDPDSLAAQINERTKAVVLVDLYGQTPDVSAVRKVVAQHGIPVVEDACQAIGATYGTEKAGSLFDVATFSLYATKNVMCGEGGLLTTNNADVAAAARRFRQHGMTGPYQYAELGYNYRLSDLHAAVARAQFDRLGEFNGRRAHNAARLTEGLRDVPGLALPTVAEGRTHVWHQYTITVNDEFGQSRDDLAAHLKDQQIGSGIYYPKPLYAYEHVAANTVGTPDCPVAEDLASRVLSLPVHPSVTDDDVDRIVDAVRTASRG